MTLTTGFRTLFGVRTYGIRMVLGLGMLIGCQKRELKLFERLDPSLTGITFSNQIPIADSLVLPGYEYIYNGGGVGVIDINNDGLQDLYFTGNLVSSKLYLNKGDFKFEDITDKAGVTTTTWANGVSVVDINQDGYSDLYISVGGHQYTPVQSRHNLLFINNKNNTFSESAASYGLDDDGYGIQAAFLDYDKDGDLDMYLLRNSFVTYPRNNARPKSINGEAPSTDMLFRNEGNNKFINVSREAGILVEGFGLGVSIADLNEDGWPDIYVSNDFVTNDLLWINNQNGTFTNQIHTYLKHQTFNGMGNDVADFNNDGLVDIIEVDMLPPDNKRWKLTPRGNSYDEFQNGLDKGYEPQYVRNTLQLNNGDQTFSEIGQLAGIEATDWSWSSLFMDIDQDGWKDLFITNGYGKDITNLDFIVYGDKNQTMGMSEASVRERQQLLNEIPGISIHNFFYKNNKNYSFEDVSDRWFGNEPSFSNGAVYVDLDNDGDQELITNNIDEPALVLKNNLRGHPVLGKSNYIRLQLVGPVGNREAIGAKIDLYSAGMMQSQYMNPCRGYLSSVEPYIHFGLGESLTIDSVIVSWPDEKKSTIFSPGINQLLSVNHDQASLKSSSIVIHKPLMFESVTKELDIQYTHKENVFTDFKVQPLLPTLHSKNGPGMAVADVNKDGRDDFFIGSGAGSSGKLFLQQSNETFKIISITGMDSLADDMGVLFFDADNDKDEDLYIVKGGSEQRSTSVYYQDKLFINNGIGSFSPSAQSLPVIHQSGSCVTACDFDKDGDLDIFRGSRLVPGSYPLPPQSFLLKNESIPGQARFVGFDFPFIKDLGMVTSALWSDFDNDGWIDLIITGEYMPILFIKNNRGKLENVTSKTELKNLKGWWNSLAAGDFDSDGDMDYLAGNLGLNTRFKASPSYPLCIYAKDYNNDGTIDPVMSHYVGGIKYANHTRDHLISQMTAMRSRFRTYTAYSNATFEQTLTSEELADAYQATSEDFESKYIENLGNGQFRATALPIQAQFSSLFGFLIDDWDGDGALDVLAVGNNYSLEVITGRSDANPGLLLKGDDRGHFTIVPISQTGFKADLDAKGMVRVTTGSKQNLIVVGNNNGPIQIFKHQGMYGSINPLPGEEYALITIEQKKRKVEFTSMTSYLSSGGRVFFNSPHYSKIEIFNAFGQSRAVTR